MAGEPGRRSPGPQRPDDHPRRRRHRRVVRPGTGPAAEPVDVPGTGGRAPDDGDVGWEPPGGEPSERDDDWYRRERPPHW